MCCLVWRVSRMSEELEIKFELNGETLYSDKGDISDSEEFLSFQKDIVHDMAIEINKRQAEVKDLVDGLNYAICDISIYALHLKNHHSYIEYERVRTNINKLEELLEKHKGKAKNDI